MKIIIAILGISLSGCCTISTQDKFEDTRNYWQGQKLADSWFKTFVELAVSKRKLNDGDIEYFYIKNKCKYTVVMNNDTKIVKSWAYKSKPEYCAISNCGSW